MSGERTESPTQRRIEDARRRGQGVGRSHELAQVMTLVAGLLAMSALLPGVTEQLAVMMREHIASVGSGANAAPARLVGDVGEALLASVTLTLPLGIAVMVAGVAGSLAGGGLIISMGSIRFDPAKLNPLTGLKRLVDKTALTRLVLNVAKLAILCVVSWQVIGNRLPGLLALDGGTGSDVAARAMSAIFELGVSVAILLAVVAVADWIIERRRATGALRMTKDEVRQEYKESEGDPQIRAQRRARARHLAFARMMDAVPAADVVVVNPIRLAVALKYDPTTMRAPMIVAKGQRLMAARIRDVARRNNVPIIEDVHLARALFPRSVGAEVPAHLYRAVARILVLVARLRAGNARPVTVRRRPTGPMRLPSWFEGTGR
jgi:flagellar biosynthetic protein FlhB